MQAPHFPNNLLQTLLVQEFRICQRAFHLLQDEQRALLHGDTQKLLNLAPEIDATLENLHQIESARLELVRRRVPKALRRSIDYQSGLQAGVSVLRSQITSLARSNTALAGRALEESQALQSHLSGPIAPADYPVVFAALQNARQALETGDRRAMAGALDDLQSLIMRLGEPNRAAPVSSQQAPKPGSVFEKITTLYQQQNAYRAIYQSKQRLQIAG